ncbi:alcohol dehydrogenase catalytic domain-containing protein [Streptomyces sp. NBC_00582]|uniref:alcohol dehydrogenase catalytic domain-containing protein n=1 Tax=Streptomyces sp. NBC_00582 TaxID=2975783 RepID=UPI002E815AE0|nr:zinc-binding dehydrogenase [Streptomyces sp. NBC_00582]WUB59376.1 zinc-binding dehydrogenase [Streptomyces sp. NBC_00582]
MRAVTLAQVPGSPEVTEAEVPRPEAGEVLVKVAASLVNGFDLGTVAGYLQGMREHRFPLIPGKDFAGTVEAVAEGFAVGDAAFGVVTKAHLGTGSMAQYVADVTAQVRAIAPDGVDAVLHLAGDLAELTALTRDGGAVASALTVPEASEDRKLQTALIRSNPTADTLSALAGQVAAGALTVPVNSEFDLERAPEAFAAFGAGTLGKIAITVA